MSLVMPRVLADMAAFGRAWRLLLVVATAIAAANAAVVRKTALGTKVARISGAKNATIKLPPARFDDSQPPINIPKNPISKDAAYQLASDFIEQAIDTSRDPCNDFGKYVCGNYQGSSTFADMDAASLIKHVQSLRSINDDDVKPVKQAKNFFHACSNDLSDPEIMNDAYYPATIVAELETTLGVKFPLAQSSSSSAPSKPVDSGVLGTALGFLAGNYLQSPMMQVIIYIHDEKPSDGYYLFFDAVSTILRVDILQDDDQWEAIKPEAVREIAATLRVYLTATLGSVDASLEQRIQAEAANIAELDRALAVGYDPYEESSGRVFHLYTQRDALLKFGNFVSIDALLTALAGSNSALSDKLHARNYKFSVAAPKNMMAFSKALAARMYVDGSAVSDETLLNYVFLTILIQSQAYMPALSGAFAHLRASEAEPFVFERPRLSTAPKPSGIHRHKPDVLKHPMLIASDVTYTEAVCRNVLAGGMTDANNRIFVDAVFDSTTRDQIRTNAAQFAASISVQMRAMIDQLQWMSRDSKYKAYGKLDNLAKNILWPNITYDDAKLESYYSELSDFSTQTRWVEQQLELLRLVAHKSVAQLLLPSYDRTEFGDTSSVNAYYRPDANSITLLGGITQPPFYHPMWPAALNYGGIGLVLGHEITHGFDSGGVYYDGVGAYQPGTWMDSRSRLAFETMAQCVVDEYSQFCDKSDDPSYPYKYCVNGDNTKGENVADNGGIRSAFNAYRAHVGLYGQDDSLPGAIASQFNADQLFFINFARTWCDNTPLDEWPWGNEHSISHFRVLGSIQNFESFRAAFNCPLESKFAPKDHCNVWIDDSRPALGVPPPS